MKSMNMSAMLSLVVVSCVTGAAFAQTTQPRPTQPRPTQPRPTQPVPPQAPPAAGPQRDMAGARTLARFVLLESSKIYSSDVKTQNDLKAWAADAQRCLISYQTGPQCLSPSYTLVDQTSFTGNTGHFFIVVHSNPAGRIFHTVISVSKDLKAAQPIRVRAFVSSNKTSAQMIRKQLDESSFNMELEGFSTGKIQSLLADRIAKTQDAGVFFHGAKALMAMDSSAEMKAQIEKLLRSSVKPLFRAANKTYREALLRMIQSDFPASRDILVSLAEELLAASDEETRALGVVLMSQAGVRSDKLKETLLGFLRGSNPARKQLALEALMDYPLNSRDQQALLQVMIETPNLITEDVLRSSEKWTVDASMILSIRSMIRDDQLKLRELGVRLLVKVKSSEAQALLVEALADDSDSVRMVAFREMKLRRVTDADFPALSRQLFLSNPAVRRNALELVQGLRGERVRGFTIQLMFDESTEVRELARQLISKDRIRESELDEIRPFLNSSKTDFRRFAVEIFAAFSSDSITAILVPMMFDENFEVRELSRATVAKRALGTESLKLLEPYMTSPNPSYRQFALTTVGGVRGVEASRLLIPLMFDDASTVREKAREMVTSRSMADTDMTLLQTYLVDSEADVRVVGVQVIAKIGKRSVEAILIERLIEEENPRVQTELRKAIKWIRTQ